MTTLSDSPEIDQGNRRRQSELCFTRRHVSMAENSFVEYARAVSRDTGIFYRDDRRDAKEFNASKSKICRIAQSLEHRGFLVLIEPRKRVPGGFYSSSRYRVLSHDEWAVAHPGECTCITSGTGDNVSDTTWPTGGTGDGGRSNLSQNSNSPVPKLKPTCPTGGTKTVKKESKLKNRENPALTFVRAGDFPGEQYEPTYHGVIDAIATDLLNRMLEVEWYRHVARAGFYTPAAYAEARQQTGMPTDWGVYEVHRALMRKIEARVRIPGDMDSLGDAIAEVKAQMPITLAELVPVPSATTTEATKVQASADPHSPPCGTSEYIRDMQNKFATVTGMSALDTQQQGEVLDVLSSTGLVTRFGLFPLGVERTIPKSNRHALRILCPWGTRDELTPEDENNLLISLNARFPEITQIRFAESRRWANAGMVQ